MWWVLIIPPAIWLGKKIFDSLDDEPSKSSGSQAAPAPPPQFDERGDLDGPKIVVIGRTGAGKSSLINMLSGRDVLAVGPVASTTRWLEGVRVEVGRREVLFVDTPGYGEAYTADDYATRLINWVAKHRQSIEMILLVLQADAKAHADDHRILHQVRGTNGHIPVMIVLNQVDKVLPTRQPFASPTWADERKKRSLKSRHVTEKIDEVRRQFDLGPDQIEPSVSVDHAFNRRRLLTLIGRNLKGVTSS